MFINQLIVDYKTTINNRRQIPENGKKSKAAASDTFF